MNELELTRILFLQLEEDEQKRVVKRAVEKGFTVDGFSKNAYKAPPRAVCACMAKKPKRGKYPHRIILGAMSEQLKSDADNIIYQLAGELLRSKGVHIEIEKELSKLLLQADAETDDSEGVSETDPDAEAAVSEEKTDQEKARLNKRIEELENELLSAKEKNKRYKGRLQENKIEMDNLIKNNDQQKKEKERCLRQIKELERQAEILKEEKQLEINRKKETERQVAALKRQNEELMEQMKELQIYKENAPTILCIAKTKYDIEIPGYHVKIVNDWDEEIKDEAVNGGYYEIWFVQRQFPYNLVNEISECLGSKLKQFLTIEDLGNVVRRGGR